NPLRLTLAFIKAARRMGAKVFARREVTGIGLRGARIGPLRTTEGEIEAKTIVNAAGVSASQIGRMVNLDIPIKPRRGQILVTEAVPPTLRCPLLSSSYITKKFESAASSAEEAGVSIEQTSNGNFLLGSTREFVGLDVRTTWEGMRGIASRTAKIVPGLRNMHIIRAFSGLRPHTPDGLPILGRVKGLDGFIMAAGHEGDGIALSPATGQLIAELIDAGSTTMDLADFGLERFLQGVEA
ncbi:MAG: FAD-binding oxidoreductase, partial [Proteobacteria bacterium]|nr:FAD-binding oxidoreductase [Pseudomonadota bacterium]